MMPKYYSFYDFSTLQFPDAMNQFASETWSAYVRGRGSAEQGLHSPSATAKRQHAACEIETLYVIG
jgi:hypothetical protein